MWYSFMLWIGNSSRFASSTDIFLPIILSSERYCTKSLVHIVVAHTRLQQKRKKNRQKRFFQCSRSDLRTTKLRKKMFYAEKLFIRGTFATQANACRIFRFSFKITIISEGHCMHGYYHVIRLTFIPRIH